MPDPLKTLEKNESGVQNGPSASSNKINNARRKISSICKPLAFESDQYKPEKTVENIVRYINDNPFERIFYSEISSFIVALSEPERATVSTNLDTLISYVLDNNGIDTNVQKICIKLYDHFQLNIIQLENAKAASDKAIAESIADEKEKLHDEVKGIQKEYITILGIFAAIMLAFVGGFTFSTSVLNNLGTVSTGELVIVALVIGLIFVFLITILIDFLRVINGKQKEKKEPSVSKRCIIAILLLLGIFGVGYFVSRVDIGTIKGFFVSSNSTESESTNKPENTEMVITSHEE